MANKRLKYVMVQAGGSSGERYIHSFNNLEECRAYKKVMCKGFVPRIGTHTGTQTTGALEDSAESNLMELLNSVAQESARID